MTPEHMVARADRPVRAPRRRPPAPQPLAPGVAALLDLQRAAGNGATAGLLVPVQRQKTKAVGVAKYGTTRLTTRLQDMMQRGVLGVAGAPATLDRDQLFMLQGVANVETGGMDNAVYTRDNMYVSLGFKQVTLGWGSLYEIIEAAPGAFAKHGIVLGGGTYTAQGGRRAGDRGRAGPGRAEDAAVDRPVLRRGRRGRGRVGDGRLHAQGARPHGAALREGQPGPVQLRG